jgi:RimJ/RimL family protein N-acetyltransferase
MESIVMHENSLELIPVQREHKIAFQKGIPSFREKISLTIPPDWPQFPEAFHISDPELAENLVWPAFLFVCRAEACLVGNGGFAGNLNSEGEVEIGYEIAPCYQNKGFATEAVRQMLQYAFARTEVSAVIAHTLAAENASNAVLKKVGMSFMEELPNDEVGKVWRWRINRAAISL